MRVLPSLAFFFFCAAAAAQPPDAAALAAQRKIDLIETAQALPGSTFVFTPSELNSWARYKARQIVPEGVSSPRLELGYGAAKAYALIDFVRARQGQGQTTNWLVAKLIEGEKPVTVNARIDSGRGRAIVHLLRVEIGGVAVTGAPLDFLIENFFRPFFPDAKIDEWFTLPGRLDRLEIAPGQVRAVMQR